MVLPFPAAPKPSNNTNTGRRFSFIFICLADNFSLAASKRSSNSFSAGSCGLFQSFNNYTLSFQLFIYFPQFYTFMITLFNKKRYTKILVFVYLFLYLLIYSLSLNGYNNSTIICIHRTDACRIHNNDIFKLCKFFHLFFYKCCPRRTITMRNCKDTLLRIFRAL